VKWEAAGGEDAARRASKRWKQVLREYEALADFVARRKAVLDSS
jgi:trimethylamine:corrinoid methyltransferase-like protein